MASYAVRLTLPTPMDKTDIISVAETPEGIHLLFIIYPNEDSTSWYCRTVPPEPSSFSQRLPLPEAWRGLQEEEFSRVAGIADGVFCHPSGFICGARSQESAIRLAEKAIAAGR